MTPLTRALEQFDKEWEKSNDWGGGMFGSLDEEMQGEQEVTVFCPKPEGFKSFISNFYRQILEEDIERLEKKEEMYKTSASIPSAPFLLSSEISHKKQLLEEIQ